MADTRSIPFNNPKPFLTDLGGKTIVVKLKWGPEYKGTLLSSDGYMNLHIIDTEEWIDGVCKGRVGEILLRCNNVLYIREWQDEQIFEAFLFMTIINRYYQTFVKQCGSNQYDSTFTLLSSLNFLYKTIFFEIGAKFFFSTLITRSFYQIHHEKY